MQLIPGRTFTIVRQLNNPFITDTFYVRAVIRDAYTDDILETLDLTDKTGQRFKGDWRVPVDPLGLGKFISIVTSVYSDSGYTTKSENYGDEENTYLVAELNQSVGKGGGRETNYTRIREIMKEEIAGIQFPKVPEQIEPKEVPMRWDEVISMLKEIESKIAAIPTEKNDDAPILSKLGEVIKAISDKEVTPATDLSPVLDKLVEDNDTNEINHDEMKAMLAAQSKEIIDSVGPTVTEVLRDTKLTTAIAANFSVGGQTKPTEKKKEESKTETTTKPEPVDPHSLAKSLSKS